MANTSRFALRRWIAIELKRLREAGGYESIDAAARIDKGVTAYRHYENAVRLPSASDVEVLLNWYGKPERVPFFRELIKAAQKGKDWWINFPAAVPDWLELYLGLEYGAARISSYDTIIPGLLQTREYAEALYRAGERRLTDDEIHTKVELRMTRQKILDRDEGAPQLWSVLDECALQRLVGGPEVMQAQLAHLRTMAERTNIEIQVLPNSAGAHAGVEGTFTILDYPAEFEGDPGTVYVETRVRGMYYEHPAEVTDFRRVFERLQMQALRPGESREALVKIKIAKER
ncbi:MAG: Scr1 family TA system antitoxin-like transcriptional regulator [Actinophytocola sp.]|uniref:Scr1 family TA system antitoxin-like transcriptional regulator n=1 Tax=Actinophytocola sp. TaxID=1872138 RepID=UPI003C742158